MHQLQKVCYPVLNGGPSPQTVHQVLHYRIEGYIMFIYMHQFARIEGYIMVFLQLV
jgi:hypothetical protein